MRATVSILTAAVALAACGKGEVGTTITLNVADGNTVASANGESGEVKLDVPGFQGKFTLPKLQVTADNFDLNGVHLYPGSTISSLNLDAGRGQDGAVRVAFTSPARPGVVRDWLMQRLNKAGFAVSASGTGLTGTTNERKPFTLDLQPAGNEAASGTITVGS